jgi:hypothetical protein
MANWTQQEIEVLREPISFADAAKRLGRNENSVRAKRQKLGIPASGVGKFKARTTHQGEVEREVNETTYTQDTTAAAGDVWRRRYAELDKKYQKSLEENSLTQQLVSEINSVAPRSYSPLPSVIATRSRGAGAPQSALLMLSDTHVGQVITPEQTLGFGGYDFDVFLARLKYLEESVVSIIENHMTVKIDELVVAMLGDMLHGNLQHSVEAGQHVTLFQQYYCAGHALAQFLRNLAPHVPKIIIRTVVGNHPRWGTQRKMPTENRYSNLDMFLYALIQALTSDIKTIQWSLDMQPFCVFEVKGFTVKASHGDHLRGGDRALGIPNHAFGREVSTTSQLFNKHGKQAPHYYLSGHLHRGIQLPHALGEIIVNGGFPGLDNYALAENFNPVDPMQRLLFIHPKYGRTAEYPLSLKFAEVTVQRPYVLPVDFRID